MAFHERLAGLAQPMMCGGGRRKTRPGNQCKVQLRSLGAGPRSAPGEGGRAS
ncbi:hypothetical protein PJP10_09420 [Mycobacterium kansasii]|uniref:Uncharacterized protein n=1 Tax=Mycobacterium kansasii TaxID=1768 RepID=A0A1V3WC97_MYCKA|nr:hypothetical protein BZL30_9164 [Mycobacterium kansasii]